MTTDPIPLSALQHYSYCPRQYALIHLEQQFAENLHTLRGQAVHALVDDPATKQEKGVRVARALPLYSLVYNLIGKADVVEFHKDGTVYPVEYKHGTRRETLHDALQLAGQAVCLEEMLNIAVPKGAIYHASSRHRREVKIDTPLREQMLEALAGIRAVQASGVLPPPVNDKRCNQCSLVDICQPQALTASQHLHLDSLFNIDDNEV